MFVSPITQVNQDCSCSFKSLKNIKYAGSFNPNVLSEHADVVKAFKESEGFKAFCKKFDCTAVFSDKSTINDWHKMKLTLKYENKEKNESVFGKMMTMINNLFGGNKNTVSISEYSGKLYSNPCKAFIEKIKNTKLEDLENQMK